MIATLCKQHDAIAICDEVYERLVFDAEHVRLATLDGMYERTVTLSSLGKTFSLTVKSGGRNVTNFGTAPAIATHARYES